MLRAELVELRKAHGRRSRVVLEAWERLWRASVELGQPLSALRRHTTDEVERFFAQTIPGPDGHVYWDGAKTFTRNDGKGRVPRRWWYAHKDGAELGPYQDLIPACGELNCINPEHCEVGRKIRRGRKFSDEQMLNAVKVAALRLGRAPLSEEWESLGLSPSRGTFTLHFGTWETVIKRAGLEYSRSRKSGRPATASDCIKALRHLRKMIGHWPSRNEFAAYRELLYVADLPSSATTVCKHLGGWPKALRKAGKR